MKIVGKIKGISERFRGVGAVDSAKTQKVSDDTTQTVMDVPIEESNSQSPDDTIQQPVVTNVSIFKRIYNFFKKISDTLYSFHIWYYHHTKSHSNFGKLISGIALILLGLIFLVTNSKFKFNLYMIPFGQNQITSGVFLLIILIGSLTLSILKNKWIGRAIVWIGEICLLGSIILSINVQLSNVSSFGTFLLLSPIIFGLIIIFECTIAVTYDDKLR